MAQLVISFIVVLHLLIRGDSTVDTIVTKLEYKFKHSFRLKNGTFRKLIFRCRQHKHTVRFKRWYIPNKTIYTYGVEVIQINDEVCTDYHIAHYPHLCLGFLKNTTFPHRCAINAHIDALEAAFKTAGEI